MKILTWKDIKESNLSEEEKKAFIKVVMHPDSKYVLLEKEHQNEYFETRSWTIKDVEEELMGYDIYPVKEVAVEIFDEEIREHLKCGLKTHEMISSLFERIITYQKEYEKIICYVSSEETDERLKVTILVKEETLEIDIIQAAKDYFISKFYNYRGMTLQYNKLKVKVGD